MKKRFRHVYLKQIRRWVHNYPAFAAIMIVAMALNFGFTFAQTNTYVDLTDTAAIATEDIPALIRDMQFEDQQVRRDNATLSQSIVATESALKKSAFSCDALNRAKVMKQTYTSFDAAINRLMPTSPRGDFNITYALFVTIRGDTVHPGLQSQMYGVRDAVTKIKKGGILDELATCRAATTTVVKTCQAYVDAVKNQTKIAPSKTTLYAAIRSELSSRCMQPNDVIKRAGVSLGDFTGTINKDGTHSCRDVGNQQMIDPLLDTSDIGLKGTSVDCNTLIEKYLGSERLLKKLTKTYR